MAAILKSQFNLDVIMMTDGAYTAKLKSQFNLATRMFPVLLVTGPRQVGKTTLLKKLLDEQKHAGKDRKYVTLDDPDIRYLAMTDPALFILI